MVADALSSDPFSRAAVTITVGVFGILAGAR